jgi:Fe2+ transport system protein FeoA
MIIGNPAMSPETTRPTGPTVLLNSLPPGAAARVVDVEGEGAFRRRLLDMGFVTGAFVRVIRHAPLRNPTEYCVSGSHVTLRSAEAARIVVTPVAAPAWKRGPGKHGLRGFLHRRGRHKHGRGARCKKADDGPCE